MTFVHICSQIIFWCADTVPVLECSVDWMTDKHVLRFHQKTLMKLSCEGWNNFCCSCYSTEDVPFRPFCRNVKFENLSSRGYILVHTGLNKLGSTVELSQHYTHWLSLTVDLTARRRSSVQLWNKLNFDLYLSTRNPSNVRAKIPVWMEETWGPKWSGISVRSDGNRSKTITTVTMWPKVNNVFPWDKYIDLFEGSVVRSRNYETEPITIFQNTN